MSELDPLTGVDGPLAWERHLSDENARVVRYGRPAAIVLAELVGLRRLSDRFGERQAERLLPAIADVFRREARRCDRVARVGWARFGVLLPETDERQAVTYVERVRAASDRWLAAGGVALRLSVGVASPRPSNGLDSAVRLAEERMYAEGRGPDGDDEPGESAGTET
jgi:diguanylate cyclase (GGDEF)-like protein